MVAWLVFALITAAPVAAGALVGRRLGTARLLRGLGLYVVGLLSFAATTVLGYQARWFWPLGLVTPIVAGGVAGVAVSWLCARARLRPNGATTSPRAGAALGAAFGAGVALLAWLALPLVDAHRKPRAAARATPSEHAAPADPADLGATLGDLATIAHRGLLRHVPVLGETSDEVAAVCTLLRATPEQHRRLAERLHIGHLADLPSVQAALANEDLVADLARARDGELLAIFRLQRHPLILATAEDDAIAALFEDLRPSRMAAELERLR